MSEPSEERLVLPGDALGTSEEFVPGRGTYEYNGQVYAALMGHPHVDTQNRTVSVKAIHEIPHMTEGELVYARVEEIKSALLITQVLSSVRSGRGVPGHPEGTLHISKAKESYVEELSREFAIGDLLKAQVLQGYPVIKLSTQGPDLGVVSARCMECHGLLALTGPQALTCSRCGHREQRKVSREYGGRQVPAGEASSEEVPGERRESDEHPGDRRRHEGGHGRHPHERQDRERGESERAPRESDERPPD